MLRSARIGESPSCGYAHGRRQRVRLRGHCADQPFAEDGREREEFPAAKLEVELKLLRPLLRELAEAVSRNEAPPLTKTLREPSLREQAVGSHVERETIRNARVEIPHQLL